MVEERDSDTFFRCKRNRLYYRSKIYMYLLTILLVEGYFWLGVPQSLLHYPQGNGLWLNDDVTIVPVGGDKIATFYFVTRENELSNSCWIHLRIKAS